MLQAHFTFLLGVPKSTQLCKHAAQVNLKLATFMKYVYLEYVQYCRFSRIHIV